MKKNVFLLVGIVLLLVLGESVLAIQDNIIPADRKTDWSRDKVGVAGGIPDRQTDCVTPECNILLQGTVTSSSINNAINSAPPNTVVRIPSGNYTFSSVITLKSNITLRGAGIDKTILTSAGTSLGTSQSAIGSPRDIISGFNKGSSQIQVSDTSGVNQGMLMVLTQDNEPGLVYGGGPWNDVNRPLRQTVMVESVGTNSITFSPALHYDFSASLNPVYSYSTSYPTTFAGLEDMTLNFGNGRSNGIWFDNTYSSWIKNIKSTYAVNAHLFFTKSLRGEVRENYIYETNSQNDGYGVVLYTATTNFLVEDNIFDSLFVAVQTYSTMGSVISYNYVYNAHTNVWPHQTAAFNSNHGAHGMMNLWEGNIGQQFQNDGYHGSCSHQTIFRNWFHGLHPTYSTNRKMIDLTRWSYYHNVVGNVLGDASWTPNDYEMTGIQSYDPSVIYRLGYPNMGNNAYDPSAAPPVDKSGQGLDPKVKATLLRHGNYDYQTMSTIWDSNISEQNLPDSLYLFSKPAFFGNLPWPPIGPDINPRVGTIPAKQRFNSQNSSSTCSSVDLNMDNTVDNSEILSYVSLWKLGLITILELVTGIEEWGNGC